jgi:hypothetical protein
MKTTWKFNFIDRNNWRKQNTLNMETKGSDWDMKQEKIGKKTLIECLKMKGIKEKSS